MDTPDFNKLDFTKISLFETPIGRTVQMESTNILLARQDKEDARSIYVKKIYDVMGHIAQSFWDIELVIKLIEFADPKIKSFKMTRVDRGDYLKYNLENYFFRVPKIKDQILNLLNVVFEMGLHPSNGLEKKVRANPQIVDGNFHYYLDYFDAALVNIKPLRDTIAHRSDLADSDLAMLTSYQLLNYDGKVYEELLKQMISNVIPLRRSHDHFKHAVITLLLTLEEPFNKIYKRFPEQKNRSPS